MFRYFAISICVISWSTRRSSNRLKYMESPRKSCYHLVTFSCDSSPIRLNFRPLYDIVCHLAMEEFFTLSAAQRKRAILPLRMAPLSIHQDRKGCALDPPLTVPARAKLYALCKGMPASFYCGFRFDLRPCPLGRYRCGVSRDIFNGSSYQHCSSG